ncbi:MFS transporter [Rhodococcus sp. ABRD24]|nr:MFS transporter [Rhodococcus sp. ABRD24]
MVLTLFGVGAWAIYLAMQTLALDATPATLSSVVAWTGVGLLVCSLIAGVVADRVAHRSVLLAVLVVNLAVTLTIGILAFVGHIQIWQLSVSAFVLGASTAFFFPAYTAMVPTLVPTEDLMAVNGLEGATRPTVQQALAPALVGALIGATIPAAGAFMIAAAYALALVIVLGLPTRPREESQHPNPLRDLVGGFAYVIRTPWVLSSVAFAAVMGLLVTGPLEVLLPALVREAHGPGVYGLLVAALGAGGLVGSMAMGSITMPLRYLSTMIGAWAIGCLPLSLVAFTSNPWILGPALFFYGGMIGAGMVIWGTLLQERVPLKLLGRVASLDFFISIAFMPVSIAMVGLLADRVSPGTLFLAAGFGPICMAALIAGVAALPAVKRRSNVVDATPDTTDEALPPTTPTEGAAAK